AHHSIGPRALVLFGTPAQQERWLPKMATGEWISAFALTEPEAGSDAANVQTQARPTPDGRGYVLGGQKRWITNGGIATVLTVLDFGRTTFGATCTGCAKFCLDRATRHAATRVQFGQTLGSFELVKEKLAWMAAGAFAMESATYQTAALIDSGAEDYMLETA